MTLSEISPEPATPCTLRYIFSPTNLITYLQFNIQDVTVNRIVRYIAIHLQYNLLPPPENNSIQLYICPQGGVRGSSANVGL